MLKKIGLSLFFFSVFVSFYGQIGTGQLKGVVIDAELNEAIPFAQVVLKSGDRVVAGASTDFDGKYIITSIPPQKYDLEVAVVGYQTYVKKGVLIKSNKVEFLDVSLNTKSELMEQFVVEEYEAPLIDKDGGASGQTVTKDNIQKLAARSPSSIVATVGGVSTSSDGQLSVRGARTDANFYYINGIKVRGSVSLPKSAIEEVNVITGGLPANYGDATGAIINITTSGAGSTTFGSVEYISSGYGIGNQAYGLDNYGYNLIEGTVGTPIWFKKDEEGKKQGTIASLLISGNLTSQIDPRPVFGGQYIVKEDKLQGLRENPLLFISTPSGTNQVIYNAENLTGQDIERVRTRQNVSQYSTNWSGNLDVNLSKFTSLRITGQLNYNKQNLSSYSGSLLNYGNNGVLDGLDSRIGVNFNHKIVGGEGDNIKLIIYNILVDYGNTQRNVRNDKHKSNLFNYGYVGRFDRFIVPSYEFLEEHEGLGEAYVHRVFRDSILKFTPSDINGDLSAITEQYFNHFANSPQGNLENFDQLDANRILINGQFPETVYSIWQNLGQPYNQYSESRTNQLRLTFSSSAIIGDHELGFGFEYERRSDRNFSVGSWSSSYGPAQLWTLARGLANQHIEELDVARPNITLNGSELRITFDRLRGGNQSQFDRSLREALGYDVNGTDYIIIDALDPSMFSLNMFSASELFNGGQSYVDYYGFDYAGNSYRKSGYSFQEDFFNTRDANGNNTYPINPFEPIYSAMYVFDKFSINDLILNVGFRLDRYDANQPVLKDRYTVAEALTVGELNAVNDQLYEASNIPSTIGEDYVVYVDNLEAPTTIRGYRNGDVWYNNNGAVISDPNAIVSNTGRVAPYLKDQNALSGNTLNNGDGFEDYKPVFIALPRISFSFPISDEAAFFAHYDHLSQRPSAAASRISPIQYLYLNSFAQRSSVIRNPALRPERTTDFALGFQKVLTKNSSLKIEGFIRDFKDQVNVVRVVGGFPSDYLTYENIDFSTVKGLTVSYDHRRTGNISVRASYTLQFADGTGSSSSSGFNLANSGEPNLRTIFPLSFDRRHVVNLNLDYRYASGNSYDGPIINGYKILESVGFNLISSFSGGTPFSGTQYATPNGFITGNSVGPLRGTLNGSRLPWSYNLNLQIDKDFVFNISKTRQVSVNVYFWIVNLLNTSNIVNVYRFTGSPSDDGYLSDVRYQEQISNTFNEDAYRYLYDIKINNPFNYSQPRQIRLGVNIGF